MNNLFEKFKDKFYVEINMDFINACKNGNLEEVKYLLNSKHLKANANVEYEGFKGFLFACAKGQLNIIDYLIAKESWKYDFQQHYENALKFACAKGHFEIVKFLLTSDMVKGRDDIIINPGFVSACESGEIEIVKYLFENYKDRLDKFSNCNSFTIENYLKGALTRACKNGQLDTLSFLLKQVKIKNEDFSYGYILKDYVEDLFSIACNYSQLQIIDYFLNSPDITKHIKLIIEQDHLEFACKEGKIELAKYFLDSPQYSKLFNLNANNDEIFIHAVKQNHNDIIQYLIFDKNIKKTSIIDSHLNYHCNEQVINWFELRNLKDDLNENLSNPLVNKTTKTKL